MLAPSVTAANGEAEGIPNAVKEAMAMGMPVVATRHSGIPELVDDSITGYLVPERDAAGLAQRLDLLYAHRELWTAMGRAARIKVETEFDKNALNDELVRLYAAVVAARPARGHLNVQHPLVSILVCTHNRAHLVRETLDSIFAQRYAPVEIIVVDDGSTDDTPAVMQSYGESHHLSSPGRE